MAKRSVKRALAPDWGKGQGKIEGGKRGHGKEQRVAASLPVERKLPACARSTDLRGPMQQHSRLFRPDQLLAARLWPGSGNPPAEPSQPRGAA